MFLRLYLTLKENKKNITIFRFSIIYCSRNCINEGLLYKYYIKHHKETFFNQDILYIKVYLKRDYANKLGVVLICEVSLMKKTWCTARFEPWSEDKKIYEANGLPLS